MNQIRTFDEKYNLSIKALYFVLSVLTYTIHSFKLTFGTYTYGLTNSFVGVMVGFFLFISYFSNIYISYLADKKNCHKYTILLSIGISGASLLLSLSEIAIKFGKIGFCITMFPYYIFNSIIIPLFDKFVAESSGSYGNQRIFDSFAFIIVTILSEYMIKEKRLDGEYDYNFVNLKILVAISAVIAVIAVVFFIKQKTETAQRNQMKLKFFGMEYLYFILIILLNGIQRSSMSLCMSLFYKDVLRIKESDQPNRVLGVFSRSFISSLTIVGVAGEIIIFPLGAKIISVTGFYWPILLGAVVQIVRPMLYYFIPWSGRYTFFFCLLIEILKGLGFGLVHNSGNALASKLCPEGFQATSQIIYNGAYSAVGYLGSSFISYIIFSNDDVESFVKFFRVNIYLGLVTMAVVVFKYGIFGNEINFRRKVK